MVPSAGQAYPLSVATILLVGDETPATLGTVRALRAAGHQPYVALAATDSYAARSRAVAGVDHLPDPYGRQAEDTVRDVVAIAVRRGADVVLPGTEGALRAITGREDTFPSGVVVGTASQEALDRAMDKIALATLAAQAGLDSLPTVEVSSRDLDERAADVPLPGVAKPRASASARPDGSVGLASARMVDTLDDVRRLLEANPNERWLVQSRVEGTLGAIGGVAWEGRMVCAVHQVSPRIWPRHQGITAFGVTVAPDRDRERGVARLLEAVGWSGIYGLQFLLAEGRAYPIDLNPRMYGSIALAIAAGLNLPAIWVDLLLGRRPVVSGYRVGIGYRVEEDDPRALLGAWRAGARRTALRGALPRRNTAHAVFSLRDPAPALVTLRKLARS
jgi:predicted ATP-grasp superfamily ATP-dependent carboligase